MSSLSNQPQSLTGNQPAAAEKAPTPNPAAKAENKPGANQPQVKPAPTPTNPAINKKKTITQLATLGVLILALFLVAKFLIPQAIVLLTKATKPSKYSLSNSYVFGAPLVAAADGKTKIRINAFLLNDQGLGVEQKTMSLTATPKTGNGTAEIEPISPTTDKFGKSTFEVTSQTPGQYVITASVDGFDLPQTVTITFR